MSTDALDLALALYGAPGQRERARELPLPDGLDRVLGIAAGVQPLLRDTAVRLRQPEAAIRDACRFYVQQILFEPGTDAYRVLGVGADADPAQIRQHYHWLQRWLHPDRADEEWDSLFASRVNWAWRQLRDAKARAAYDAGRVVERAPVSRVRTAGTQPIHRAWLATPVPVAAGRRWGRRVALAAVLAGCAGLFVMAFVRNGQVPAASLPFASGPAGSATSAASPPVASNPGLGSMHLRAVRVAAGPPADGGMPTAEHRAERGGAVASKPADQPMGDPRSAAQRRARLAAASPLAAGDARPAVPVASALRGSAAADSKPVAQAAPRAALPVVPRLAAATVVPPALPKAIAPLRADLIRVDAVPSPAPPAARAAGSAPLAGIGVAAMDPALKGALPAAELLQRTELAQQRVRAIVAYFRGHDDQLTVWRDAASIDAIQTERQALLRRFGVEGVARFALDAPEWRTDGRTATVRARYGATGAASGDRAGTFRLRLAWRDGAWRVTHVELDPLQ